MDSKQKNKFIADSLNEQIQDLEILISAVSKQGFLNEKEQIIAQLRKAQIDVQQAILIHESSLLDEIVEDRGGNRVGWKPRKSQRIRKVEQLEPVREKVSLLDYDEAEPMPQIESMPVIDNTSDRYAEEVQEQIEVKVNQPKEPQVIDIYEKEEDLELEKDFDLFSADLEEAILPRQDREVLEELFYEGLLEIDARIEEEQRA